MRTYYDDDFFGPVRYRDKHPGLNSRKAKPADFVVDKRLPESERKRLKQEIANDVNRERVKASP